MRTLLGISLVVAALAAAGSARAQSVLPRAGWVATGSPSGGGTPASGALDGNGGTRWSTGANQTPGQWFSLDMLTPQAFSQVTLDPGSASGDYIRAYQVFVSNDAVTWGNPVASGTGGAGILTVVFPTQTARFVGIVETGSAGNAWSIAEINVYGPGAVPTVALSPSGWVASASATGGSDVASRALDGLVSTRWSSGVPQASGQSFQVDLRGTQTLTKLTMDAGPSTNDFPRAFQVFATNDTASWGAAIASGTGTSSLVSVSFPQKAARYLKIVLTGGASNWWSIAELTVFGVGDFSPVAMALPRTGWTATASVVCPGDVPARALDDNASTRFSTGVNQANGQTFTVDMLVQQSFTKITLDAAGSSGDYPRGYQVFSSNDGTTWGSAIASGAGTSALVTISFAPQVARFIKIVATASSSSSWWSIAELNVYGTPPVELIRNGWVASASAGSSTAQSGIDGNLGTRFTTGVPQTNGQWFQIDMRTAQTFDEIILDATGFSGDYPRGYQVFASNNPASLGTAIASGTASSAVVSVGFPTQTARYLRVVQTGSTSSWWSIAELNVFAAPAVVEITNYLTKTYYSSSDVASSFVSSQGDAVDCIDFNAQHSVRAWRARGVTIPTTRPSAPPRPAGTTAPNAAPGLAFKGQVDVNGRPQQCAAGFVPVMRPTVAQIQAAGGVAAYQAKAAARRHRLIQEPTQHDCWLNSAPGDGASQSEDWEHAAVLQDHGWLPAGATGFYGAHVIVPTYKPFLQVNEDHTDAQFWIQSGTCVNWFNPIADIIARDQTKNQCSQGAACTTCTGAGCTGCAVQSLEMVSFLVKEDAAPHLSIFFTNDGYFANNCWAGSHNCPSCPVDPMTGAATDCFIGFDGAAHTPDMQLTVKMPNGTEASQYNTAPAEMEYTAWNGTAAGMPGWWLWVNNELIGYYPPETFNWSTDGTPGPLSAGPATYVQYGGEVFNTWPGGFHTDTAMVSDNPAEAGFKYAAYTRNMTYLDGARAEHDADLWHIATPPEEGDLGIPGLCGLKAGDWVDATGQHGGYTASELVPPGDSGWGKYYYFGGGLLSRQRGPSPVTITLDQYGACSLVQTDQGGASPGPHAAYLVYRVTGWDNSGSAAVPFALDPKRFYLLDKPGLRDYVDDGTSQFYRFVLGPNAVVPTTIPAGVHDSFQTSLYMMVVVNTTDASGPTEASNTRYELIYDRKPGDPKVIISNSTPTPPNLPVNGNCSGLGLSFMTGGPFP